MAKVARLHKNAKVAQMLRSARLYKEAQSLHTSAASWSDLLSGRTCSLRLLRLERNHDQQVTVVAGPPSTVDSRVGTASVVSDEPICRLPFSAFLHPGPTGVVSTSGRTVVCMPTAERLTLSEGGETPTTPWWADDSWCPVIRKDIPAGVLVCFRGQKIFDIALTASDLPAELSRLSSCLSTLQNWFCHNGLALNSSKSESILFGDSPTTTQLSHC